MIKTLFLVAFIFLLASCSGKGGGGSPNVPAQNPQSPSNPKPPGNSENPGEKPADDEPAPGGCAFEIVPVPENFDSILERQENQFLTATAIRTPKCKTVALGYANSGRFYIARFNDDKSLDTDFYERGYYSTIVQKNFSLRTMDAKATNSHIFLFGFAWNPSDWDGGVYVTALNREGEPDTGMYKSGSALKLVVLGNSSTDFKVTSSTLEKNQLSVNGEYFNQAKNAVIPYSVSFTTKLPKLGGTTQPIPATCDNYKYNGHAINSMVHSLNPVGCDRIAFAWSYLDYGGDGEREGFDIVPDGRCFYSKRFGHSCFSYEGSTLVRTFVDSNWDVQRHYWSVVENHTGNLCGYSGFDGQYLIASLYPPTNPEFKSHCLIY